jgi:hypothetical protein
VNLRLQPRARRCTCKREAAAVGRALGWLRVGVGCFGCAYLVMLNATEIGVPGFFKVDNGDVGEIFRCAGTRVVALYGRAAEMGWSAAGWRSTGSCTARRRRWSPRFG